MHSAFAFSASLVGGVTSEAVGGTSAGMGGGEGAALVLLLRKVLLSGIPVMSPGRSPVIVPLDASLPVLSPGVVPPGVTLAVPLGVVSPDVESPVADTSWHRASSYVHLRNWSKVTESSTVLQFALPQLSQNWDERAAQVLAASLL